MKSNQTFEGISSTPLIPLAEMERRYILRVVEALDGNRALAAKTLEVDRKTLCRKLEQYGFKEEKTFSTSK